MMTDADLRNWRALMDLYGHAPEDYDDVPVCTGCGSPNICSVESASYWQGGLGTQKDEHGVWWLNTNTTLWDTQNAEFETTGFACGDCYLERDMLDDLVVSASEFLASKGVLATGAAPTRAGWGR